MIQAWRQFSAVVQMFRTELLRDLLQRQQMRRRIAIPERVIGDEIETAL